MMAHGIAQHQRAVSGLKYMTCPAAEVLPAENTPGISAVPSQPLQAGRRLRGEGEVCSAQPSTGCN